MTDRRERRVSELYFSPRGGCILRGSSPSPDDDEAGRGRKGIKKIIYGRHSPDSASERASANATTSDRVPSAVLVSPGYFLMNGIDEEGTIRFGRHSPDSFAEKRHGAASTSDRFISEDLPTPVPRGRRKTGLGGSIDSSSDGGKSGDASPITSASTRRELNNNNNNNGSSQQAAAAGGGGGGTAQNSSRSQSSAGSGRQKSKRGSLTMSGGGSVAMSRENSVAKDLNSNLASISSKGSSNTSNNNNNNNNNTTSSVPSNFVKTQRCLRRPYVEILVRRVANMPSGLSVFSPLNSNSLSSALLSSSIFSGGKPMPPTSSHISNAAATAKVMDNLSSNVNSSALSPFSLTRMTRDLQSVEVAPLYIVVANRGNDTFRTASIASRDPVFNERCRMELVDDLYFELRQERVGAKDIVNGVAFRVDVSPVISGRRWLSLTIPLLAPAKHGRAAFAGELVIEARLLQAAQDRCSCSECKSKEEMRKSHHDGSSTTSNASSNNNNNNGGNNNNKDKANQHGTSTPSAISVKEGEKAKPTKSKACVLL